MITSYAGNVVAISSRVDREGNLILEIEIDDEWFLFAGRRKHVYYLTRRQQEVLVQAVGRREEETL